MEVDDVEKLTFEPLLVLVLILYQTIIELFLDVREYVQELIEVLLRDHAYCRIVLGLDGGRALRARQQSYLTEVLAGVERSNEPLLPMFILNEALTLALRDNEEVICSLALLNFDLFRLAHHQLNFRDHVVFDFRVEGEDQVLLQLFRKDETRHLLLERGTDHPEELS